MRKILFFAFMLTGAFAMAQQNVKPAAKGVVYGTVTTSPDGSQSGVVRAEELKTKAATTAFTGKIGGKVVEVCQAEGCWLKIQRSNGAPIMVRAKDHSFTVPQSLVGKTVIIDGVASMKEVSEAMRKHYAEDAGKSKEEIAKIKGPENDVQVSATGVMVMD